MAYVSFYVYPKASLLYRKTLFETGKLSPLLIPTAYLGRHLNPSHYAIQSDRGREFMRADTRGRSLTKKKVVRLNKIWKVSRSIPQISEQPPISFPFWNEGLFVKDNVVRIVPSRGRAQKALNPETAGMCVYCERGTWTRRRSGNSGFCVDISLSSLNRIRNSCHQLHVKKDEFWNY